MNPTYAATGRRRRILLPVPAESVHRAPSPPPPPAQDPPIYRALMRAWADRGRTLPGRHDPEWVRLAAPSAMYGYGSLGPSQDPRGEPRFVPVRDSRGDTQFSASRDPRNEFGVTPPDRRGESGATPPDRRDGFAVTAADRRGEFDPSAAGRRGELDTVSPDRRSEFGVGPDPQGEFGAQHGDLGASRDPQGAVR